MSTQHAASANKSPRNRDMTTRPLMGKILLFSLPLIATGILQLLYNAADIIVLGRFAADPDASAGAVGSTGALVNLVTNLFIGLSVGACSAAARWIGAGQRDKLDRVVHTAVLVALICGVFLGVLGVSTAEYMLIAMGMPQDTLLPLATLYLRIYFAGMPFNLLFNFGSSLLRARGDTKYPLLFLSAAGVANIGLNLLLVIAARMDVAGVGIATLTSQCISATLVVVCLVRTKGPCKLSLRRLRIHKDALLDMMRVGLPAGVQGCIFSLSNVVIQSSINGFGGPAITGNAEAANVEGFVYVSMNAVSEAALTFTGQNYGAGKKKHISIVLWDCLAAVTGVGLVMGVSVYLCGNWLMRIYTSTPQVIAYGVEQMSVICTLYFLCGLMEVFVGALRGLGQSVVPMAVSIVGVCGVRILWVFTVFAAHRTLLTLYLSYPISWAFTAAVHGICYIFVRRHALARLDRVEEAEQPPAATQADPAATAERVETADADLLPTAEAVACVTGPSDDQEDGP